MNHETTAHEADGSGRPLAKPSSSSWISLGAMLLVAAGTVVWLVVNNRYFFHDDAFISLRYVANLLDHGELVWNLGERVEGYTSFLFIALTAGLQALGAEPVVSGRIVNFAALIGLAFVFLPTARRLVDWPATLVGWVLLLTSPTLVAWAWGGLEAPLLAFLVLVLHACVLAQLAGLGGAWLSVAAGLIAGLAVLTRQDGALFVATSAAMLLLASGSWRTGLARTVTFSIGCGAVVVAFLLWRLSYYGDLLPNTYYAKAYEVPNVASLAGVRYLLDFTLEPPFLPLLGLAGIIAGWFGRWRAETVYLAGSAGLYALYVAWAGGDHMPQFRLLAPLVPLLSLLTCLAAARLLERGVPTLALAGLTSVLVVLHPIFTAPRPMDPAAFVGTIVGRYIAEHWTEGALVALNTAGSTPFQNLDKRFIDMLGLNDATIARRRITTFELPRQRRPGHHKGDGAYVLSRRPDYIILGPADGLDASDPWFLSDLELSRSAEFANCYVERRASAPYSAEFARRGPPRPNPLMLTYFERIDGPQCGGPS